MCFVIKLSIMYERNKVISLHNSGKSCIF